MHSTPPALTMNNNKKTGLRRERDLKHLLEKEGYQVTRARGSFGLFDLIALGHGRIRLIQVKTVRTKYGSFKGEKENIARFNPEIGNLSKELWIYWGRLKGRLAHWTSETLA